MLFSYAVYSFAKWLKFSRACYSITHSAVLQSRSHSAGHVIQLHSVQFCKVVDIQQAVLSNYAVCSFAKWLTFSRTCYSITQCAVLQSRSHSPGHVIQLRSVQFCKVVDIQQAVLSNYAQCSFAKWLTFSRPCYTRVHA